MKPSDFIVEVSESDFEQQVIAYSHQIPVVVDFWAEWCAPCRVLGPILEKLANEAAGGFRLAKLNVDQNPKLAMRYMVQSIPAVKTFRDGLVVSEFAGALPENKIREFLREVIPSQSDLLLEKAWSLVEMGKYQDAESTFRNVLQEEDNSPSAELGLAKCLLFQGRTDEAFEILVHFPASRESSSAELLLPVAKALLENPEINTLDTGTAVEAAYLNALRLVERGNIEAAIDGLLDVMKEDKHYRNDQVRKIILGLLELLGDYNPQTRAYRNELASVLF